MVTNLFNHGTASTTTVRTNYQYKELGEFLFPLEKIILATENFSSKHEIGDGNVTKVYKGKIFERSVAFKRYYNKGEQQFFNELEIVSSFKHKNIIPFIGYCYEGGEMIMIYEYAVNGSLDRHLQDPDRRRRMTWAERLKICIGAATAFSYLHSELGDECGKVIHGNIKSGKVLLDDNLEATISGFGMSIVVPKDQRQAIIRSFGTPFYVDPIFQESDMLQTESDMYSFGMVLFEIVSGMLAYHKRRIGDERPQNLRNLVRRYYDDGLENLIDPSIRDSIDDRSFRVFKEIAYKCISFNLKERPSMNRVIRRINEALKIQNQRDASTLTIPSLLSQKQDLRIPLEEIEKAIKEFGKRPIGSGTFGTVYKGKLSERWNNRIAAIKCLKLNGDEGKPEFDNELKLISNFQHENIIDFIGYCDKDNDRILVFEYAVNGSLERHLEEPDKDRPITWAERLKICIGAARGLKYLHLGGEDKKKVIHRDVKSGNILLDEKFEAKICDFGLSKSGPDYQPYSKLFTRAAGTPYYIDPSYREGGILRTESDVYSFGVVMFELLTWIPAWDKRSIGDSDPQLLINLVRRYSLDKLVDPLIKDKSDSDSLRTFADIAYKCIDLNLEKRPTMY
ncbi:death-associated protein kinase 1 [Artemisia annua]|uniref:non-specific serine/threonine protein kinase n=1 Tax=Artemisia annua TaxID=35608 RepID=A0A2U1MPI0_ARTAN|nr:death-associated protein kinase 1 [Artemisia annua]